MSDIHKYENQMAELKFAIGEMFRHYKVEPEDAKTLDEMIETMLWAQRCATKEHLAIGIRATIEKREP